ncbi:MAG TPA: fumarylacetoacetate hydrolase family protein [Ignavibacteriaceae bacterium]|nr:fumarylacetoacetate hydrolase family protein [Ignavibacteriaceae bacterium]
MKNIKKSVGHEFAIGKIVCVGRNYAEHAKELGNEIPEKPVIFLKPSSALVFTGDKIIHPNFSEDMHHEVELVILIGKDGENITVESALDYIEGYGVGLDMTLRDIQNELKSKGHPWTIAKCFNTSAVISEIIGKEFFKYSPNMRMSLWVNNSLKQSDSFAKMIFPPEELISYISSIMKLEAGDLIFTGTPAGVGKVVRGDKLEAKIEDKVQLQTEII